MIIKQKKLITIFMSVIVILLIASASYVFALNNSYKTKLQQGENLMSEGKYEEAKKIFTELKDSNSFTKNLTLLNDHISDADLLITSSNNYNDGESLFAEKKYLEAIEKYKNVDSKDVNFDESQNKITLCNAQYIEGKLNESKELASNKKYQDSLIILDDLLKLYSDNQSILSLKNQYTTELDLQKKAEAEAEAESQKSSQVVNTTKQTPPSTTSNSSNEYPKIIVGIDSIKIIESPQDEVGKFLSGTIILMGPHFFEPTALNYRISLCGNTSLSLNYTATLNFNGKTYTKSGQFSYSTPGRGHFSFDEYPPDGTTATISFTVTYKGKQYSNSQQIVYHR